MNVSQLSPSQERERMAAINATLSFCPGITADHIKAVHHFLQITSGYEATEKINFLLTSYLTSTDIDYREGKDIRKIAEPITYVFELLKDLDPPQGK